MKRYPNHATDDSMVDNQIGIITTPNLKVSNNPRCINIIYGTYGDPYDAQKYKIRCLLCVLPFQYSDMDLYFLDLVSVIKIVCKWEKIFATLDLNFAQLYTTDDESSRSDQ